MDVQPSTAAVTAPLAATETAAAGGDGPSFRDILSACNPLQYLPVVGTIYRAVTGDVIPEGLRAIGSFLVSGLTGGPVGMALNAATVIAEKITGIDTEAIARDLIAGLGLGLGPSPLVPAAPDAPARAADPVLEAGRPEALAVPCSSSARAACGLDRPLAVPEMPPLAPASGARLREGLAQYQRRAIA